jgi:hypothetical protein
MRLIQQSAISRHHADCPSLPGASDPVRDLDGRVLSEISELSWLSQRQPQFTKTGEFDKIERVGGYCREEEREVLDRPRGLGYID